MKPAIPACCLMLLAPAALAQIQEAPIEAAIEVSNQAPFVKETFFITLAIIARGVEIRQPIDLANLPDAGRISIFTPFETLPVQRDVQGHLTVETRRYRARARALTPEPVSIAPVLRLTAQRRVRSFFGSMVEESPMRVEIAPVPVRARPLPPPPDGFCGAVGDFKVDISADPLRVVAGDLVTVSIRIGGEGYLDDLVMPAVPEAPLLKTYPVKSVQSDSGQRRFAQTVIPESDAVTEIPALRLTLFDTGQGRYVTHSAGPFALLYREARPRVVEHFRPDEPAEPDGRGGGERDALGHLRRRLAAARGVSAVTSLETAVRLAPSLASLSTFRVPSGKTVQVLEYDGEWLLVEYLGNRGWLHASAIAPDDADTHAESPVSE